MAVWTLPRWACAGCQKDGCNGPVSRPALPGMQKHRQGFAKTRKAAVMLDGPLVGVASSRPQYPAVSQRQRRMQCSRAVQPVIAPD